MEQGGTLYNILKAQSVLKLEKKVLETRRKIETDFNMKLAKDPGNMELIKQKTNCLAKFDAANRDTMDQMNDARKVFSMYPDFSGLLL